MDNNQGPCETHLGEGSVERQISQTNNLKEEAVVMPEQLEKNIDADDLPPEDLVGKVQVNSSEVEGDANTYSVNPETKTNGHSNGYVNGVSGDDSEAEIDGSDSEIEYKETGLNLLANTPNDNAGETESDDNLAAGVVPTSNSVAESDLSEPQPEETMGPNNEAASDVSYDIDLDKSVPELVTEYELLSQGTSILSQSVIQSESTFVSSTSSTSSVKTSKIPVAVDKKKSSVITRQNTYTVESSIPGDDISSSGPTKDISMTEDDNMEDEIDASISSLLQRQNTYTVKTSTVQESSKVSSQDFKSFSVEKKISSNSQLILQEAERKIEGDLEATEETSEGSVDKPKAEEVHVPEVVSENLAVLDTAPTLNEEITQQASEISAEKETSVETFTLPEVVSEKLTVLDAAPNLNEEIPQQTTETFTLVEKSEENVPIIEQSEIVHVPMVVSENSAVLETAQNLSEEIPQQVLEILAEKETFAETLTAIDKSDEQIAIVEEPFSEMIIQKVGAQNIIEPTESLNKEPEDAVELILQEAETKRDDDAEITEEIIEGSVDKPKDEEVHLPEEVSEKLAVLDTAPTLNEEITQQASEVSAEKETSVETFTLVGKSEEHAPIVEKTEIVEEPFSDEIIIQKLGEQNITESTEPLYKEPEDALEPEDTQYRSAANEVSIAKVEDQYVTAEEVRIQKHKVVVKDEIFPEDAVLPQSIPDIIPSVAVEIQDLTKEPTIMEETSLLSSHIPVIVPLVSIPVRSANTEDEETDPDKNVENEDIRTSKDVEQLLRDIRDPNLDCSLEDIEAMIEGKELVPPKEELNRVSPEFATAATLIDQNPDKGFDPEDPAVKGIEDWECSNLNTSLESVESRSSKLKNVFKRRRSRSEERKSLLDEKSNGNNNEEEDDDEKMSMGCINSWLLYIFIKIFD